MPPPDPSAAHDPRRSRAARAWVAVGLLSGGALAFGRLAVLYELARGARGLPPLEARHAAAAELLPTALHALVFGLAAGALTAGPAAPARAPGGFLFAVLLLLSPLTGWPMADPADLALPSAAPAISNLWVLVALSLAAGAILCLVGARLRRGGRAAAALGSLPALALIGAALAAAALSWGGSAAPAMPVREVVAELLWGDRLETVEAVPGCAPRAAILTPLVDLHLDTGDKPAWIMPPPCEVAFEVLPEEGEVRLQAAAGVDIATQRVFRDLPAGYRLKVRFEVEVDGASAFDQTIVVGAHEELRGLGGLAACEWRHVGGSQGLALRPGQRVVLRTSLPEIASVPAGRAGELVLGFGELLLERWGNVPRTTASRETPNLVLIVMDTLRADRMSCYGCRKLTTPHLDQLAARGTVFDEAYASSSWTWPATASILTGLLPYEHGVVSNESSTLVLGCETVAEVLQRRGYTTGAISCNPLIAPERYFDQGFEEFDSAREMRMTDEVIDDVLAWLERHAHTRFFLYLHLVDPHTPHRPLAAELERLGAAPKPADFDRLKTYGARSGEVDGIDHWAGELMSGAGRDPDGTPHPERVVPEAHRRYIHDVYDASVATGDHYCGEILAALERLGLDDETVVVFTSDHGEELFDRGLLAHGHGVQRELVRVPLIVAGPHVPRGVRVAAEVSNRRVAPTLAALGGGRMARVDAPGLLGEEPAAGPVFYATEKGFWNGRRNLGVFGLRAEGFVLQHAPRGADWNADEPPAGGQNRLFRLEDDRDERVDVALLPAHAQRLAALLATLRARLREQNERRLGAALGVGGTALADLIKLGYAGGGEHEKEEGK